MGKRDTKQVILEVALELFSSQGYDGVTVADIATAVGIKAASLYKHYQSKQDIFDSLLEKSITEYKKQASTLNIDGTDYKNDIQRYVDIELEELISIGTALFLYFLHDDTAKKLRRMLTIEQYKNSQVAELFTDNYIDGPLEYQKALFQAFMQKGTMQQADSKIAAAHFYSPIYLMLCLCDTYPERESEALVFIRNHITQFKKLYMNEGKL